MKQIVLSENLKVPKYTVIAPMFNHVPTTSTEHIRFNNNTMTFSTAINLHFNLFGSFGINVNEP